MPQRSRQLSVPAGQVCLHSPAAWRSGQSDGGAGSSDRSPLRSPVALVIAVSLAGPLGESHALVVKHAAWRVVGVQRKAPVWLLNPLRLEWVPQS